MLSDRPGALCRGSNPAAWEAVITAKQRIKPNYRRRVLLLLDLDHCKTTVLKSENNPPPSYANCAYYGIHTFRFINRKGKTALVKSASSRGTERSSCPNAEMQLAPRDFLERALIERTKKGPVRWEPGDPEENPTILWPKTREEG